MDVDDTPAPLICFICGGPETPVQKLVQVTQKGYSTLLTYAEVVGNAIILERMEAWNVGRLRYHFECKRDLYNMSVKVTKKSARKYGLQTPEQHFSFQFLQVQQR